MRVFLLSVWDQCPPSFHLHHPATLISKEITCPHNNVSVCFFHAFCLSVVRKYPLLKLKCPRGLKESEFLELLKSTFPQLSGDDKRFDILTPDERRRLRPVKLRTLITDSNHGNISRTGRASSTLYIRLKVCRVVSTETCDSVSCCWNSNASFLRVQENLRAVRWSFIREETLRLTVAS